MTFRYQHRIHFRDTDAAGVVFFSNILSFFHEAYEASLAASGIDIRQFFRVDDLAVPIVHSNCDFHRPMQCGEIYDIMLTPQQESVNEFSISYQSFKADGAIRVVSEDFTQEDASDLANKRASATALTRHVTIQPRERRRIDIPPMLLAWIEQWSD